MEPAKLKFVRDQICVDDIEGTKPKVEAPKPVRDPISVTDIAGAGVRKPYQRKTNYQNIDYRDITAVNWETARHTNPLAPDYAVRDKIEDGDFMKMTRTGLNARYGKIEANQPCALPPAISGVRNLDTLDIGGAQHDTKMVGPFTHYKRREQVRPVGRNDDVPGSKCGSLRKSFVSDRRTNPLVPVYQLPGNGDNHKRAEINDPYADFKKAVSQGSSKRRSAVDAINDECRYSAAEIRSSHHSQKSAAAFRHTAPAVSCGASVVSGAKSTSQKLDAFIK